MASKTPRARSHKGSVVRRTLWLVVGNTVLFGIYHAATYTHGSVERNSARIDNASRADVSKHKLGRSGQNVPPRQTEPAQQASRQSGSSHQALPVLGKADDYDNIDSGDSERLIEYFVEHAVQTLSPAELHRLKDRPWDRLPLALRQAEQDYLNASDQDREDAERRYDAVFNFAATKTTAGPDMSEAEAEAYERYQDEIRQAAPHLDALDTEEADAVRESIKDEAFLPLSDARANEEKGTVR